MAMSDDVLARLEVSPGRRFFGFGVLAVLGGMLSFLALGQGEIDIGFRILLLGFGASGLWVATTMLRVTSAGLELTADVLRSDTGEVIARVCDIASVDRGVFAFKPSNGFLLRLKHSSPICWRPGLWWCLGRRVGVGGVTSASQTKAMAEILSIVITENDRN